MSDYPEHDKMAAVTYDSQIIGRFVENAGYTLCVVIDGEYRAVNGMSTEAVLADYFGIDLKTIDAEKRAMLAALRNDPRAPGDPLRSAGGLLVGAGAVDAQQRTARRA